MDSLLIFREIHVNFKHTRFFNNFPQISREFYHTRFLYYLLTDNLIALQLYIFSAKRDFDFGARQLHGIIHLFLIKKILVIPQVCK